MAPGQSRGGQARLDRGAATTDVGRDQIHDLFRSVGLMACGVWLSALRAESNVALEIVDGESKRQAWCGRERSPGAPGRNYSAIFVRMVQRNIARSARRPSGSLTISKCS